MGYNKLYFTGEESILNTFADVLSFSFNDNEIYVSQARDINSGVVVLLVDIKHPLDIPDVIEKASNFGLVEYR